MSKIVESVMLICFGFSWPLNIAKSIRSKTAKGKSVGFEMLIIIGYLSGLSGKLISGDISYVTVFYIVDILMVSTDLCLTMINRRRDWCKDDASSTYSSLENSSSPDNH